MGWRKPSMFTPHPSLWGGVMEVHNGTHQWKHQLPPSGKPYKPGRQEINCTRQMSICWDSARESSLWDVCSRNEEGGGDRAYRAAQSLWKFVKTLRLSQSTPHSPVSSLGGGRRQWHYVMGNSNFIDSVVLSPYSRVYSFNWQNLGEYS